MNSQMKELEKFEINGPLGVTLVCLLGLVGGQRATLPAGQLGFFQFGHPTVAAGVDRPRTPSLPAEAVPVPGPAPYGA
jgi:hypothetical protein